MSDKTKTHKWKWRDSLSRAFNQRQQYREEHGEYPKPKKTQPDLLPQRTEDPHG